MTNPHGYPWGFANNQQTKRKGDRVMTNFSILEVYSKGCDQIVTALLFYLFTTLMGLPFRNASMFFAVVSIMR